MNNIIKITLLLIISALDCIAQIDAIKKNCEELTFSIPIQAKKFDVRTKLHSDDKFYNISDKPGVPPTNDFVIGAYFNQNFKLRYSKYARKGYIFYYFTPNTEQCNTTKLGLYFKVEDLPHCIEQYKEIIEIFKNLSFTSSSTDVYRIYEKTGEETTFFASETAYNNRSLDISYFLSCSYRFLSIESGYLLEIYVNHDCFY